MTTLKVYGASDDLIEIEGDIREEFPARPNEEGNLLAFSDGTILAVVYSETGVWRITPVLVRSMTFKIDQAPEDNDDDYSDVALIEGNIEWVVFGSAYKRLT